MSPNSHQKYCLLPFASFADPLWKVLFQPVFLCICYSVFNRITACLRGLITAITSEINKIFLPNCTYLLDTIHDMTVRPGNDKNSKCFCRFSVWNTEGISKESCWTHLYTSFTRRGNPSAASNPSGRYTRNWNPS